MNSNSTYFITGIGTDVGKTIVAAIVSEKLSATYWKPIQSGASMGTDRETVEQLCSSAVSTIPETYIFDAPVSPLLAAEMEGVTIDLSLLHIPKVSGNLIIEGAGGVMVPITSNYLYADWIRENKVATIVVSSHYLGSINHTLLTIEQLKQLGVPIAGIIFVGDENKDTETIISHFSQVPILGRIDWTENICPDFIRNQTENIKL